MRITWLWARGPDDETAGTRCVPQARSRTRRTARRRTGPPASIHRPDSTEGNTRHV